MARPRKQTAEAIEDYFAEMPVEDQATLLRVLEAIHRQAKRVGSKPTPVDSPLFQQAEESDT